MLVFAKVVQAGSFIAASRELDMPRSTVSRKVADLEKRLDARLLQRTTRSLRLTEVGEAYYRHAAQVVAELEKAEVAVTRMQEAPRGLIRVTAPVSFGQLGPIVASFLSCYPDVQVELVCADRVVDLVAEGFDVGVRVGRLRDSSLVARSLGVLRNLAVASPTFVAEQGAPSTPADLVNFDLLTFGGGSERSHWPLTDGTAVVAIPVDARLIVNDFAHLQDAVRAGIGVGLLSTVLCTDDIRSGRLVRVLPGWCSPQLPVHAVYPSKRHLSPKVRALVDYLREHLIRALGVGTDEA